jgi:hypothetical protein
MEVGTGWANTGFVSVFCMYVLASTRFGCPLCTHQAVCIGVMEAHDVDAQGQSGC